MKNTIFAVGAIALIFLVPSCRHETEQIESAGEPSIKKTYSEYSAVTNVFKNDKVEIIGETDGTVSIKANGLTERVSVASKIPGCIGEAYDPHIKGIKSTSLKLGILDVKIFSNTINVLVVSFANGNCNVQGRCGAAVDSAVILIKKPISTNESTVIDSVTVSDCANGIIMGLPENPTKYSLALVGGVLELPFYKFGNETVGNMTKIFNLRYNAEMPGASLLVRTN